MGLPNSNLYKIERKIQKEKRRLEKSSPSNEKINILCVRFGNKYGLEYVEKLRNMVQRNITIPYNIFCLTDSNHSIKGVTNIYQKNQGYEKGWWHKVHMFDPNLPISGRILYFDLDVIIHSNIDKLAYFNNKDFVGIRDFNRKFHPSWRHLNSSVMAWNQGTQEDIFLEFKKNPSNALRLHGDQDWIFKVARQRINFWPDEWIQSYKWEIRSRAELGIIQGKRRFKEVKNQLSIHPECCVAVFHGEPNPSDVHDKFVVDNWQ